MTSDPNPSYYLNYPVKWLRRVLRDLRHQLQKPCGCFAAKSTDTVNVDHIQRHHDKDGGFEEEDRFLGYAPMWDRAKLIIVHDDVYYEVMGTYTRLKYVRKGVYFCKDCGNRFKYVFRRWVDRDHIKTVDTSIEGGTDSSDGGGRINKGADTGTDPDTDTDADGGGLESVLSRDVLDK